MVTAAPVGGVTVAGLTRQPWFPGGAGVIAQVNETVSLNPFRGVSTRFEDAVPFGSTEPGLKPCICRVKLCATAKDA